LYSLEKCCEALPKYSAAISHEVGAIQRRRREELQRVMVVMCGLQDDPSSRQAAAKAEGNTSPPPQTGDSSAKSASAPSLNVSTAEVAAAVSPASATFSHVSPQPSASAVQPEVGQLSTLQELLEQLPFADKSPEDQKQWIKQNAAELGQFSKQQRTLLNEFARGPPAAKDKKDKDKKETASEPVSQQPPVSSVPVHESPSSASTAAAQPAPPTAPPGDSRAPAGSAATALSPAEAAGNTAHDALCRMFYCAGVVPTRDYQELARKLIAECFPSESVIRRGLRDDPALLCCIGMKVGQLSCLTRYVSKAPAAAGAAPPAHPEAAALSNLKSLFAAAGVIPDKDLDAEYDTMAQRLMEQGVADGISLRDSLACSPPAFDLKSIVVKRGQAYTIMDFVDSLQ